MVLSHVSTLVSALRTASLGRCRSVKVHYSQNNVDVLSLMRRSGYIVGFSTETLARKKQIEVFLRYHEGRAVIRGSEIISKPGRQVYMKYNSIMKKFNPQDFVVISSPHGWISLAEAMQLRSGGEVMFQLK
eukprot:TRINITY_DN362_c0_g1_i1.p1 TRINITY_DN362_c0_g1~~TRINITY_DN362_c0_g1_i1.p1  ORF type:complete len:131 (+),score=58.73 TRINITY_DN362_c0_g1_i1:181-573(+)